MPAIASLRARAEEIRAAELAKLGDAARATSARTLESVTAQILNKLLHLPTVRMKEAARRRRRGVRRGGAPPVRARRESGSRPCSSASARAAPGSRSRRPSSRPARCGRPATRSRSCPITTAGDRDRKSPFGQIGERGVFVKEIEEALLAGRIDVAVHSAKDMTSTDTEGLAVGAYLERDDPRDALVGADAIRPGMRIGTASVRRRRSCSRSSRRVSVEPLRGNIDTRLRKARERGLDALVLAACGLDRLGLAGRDRRCASRSRRCSRRRRRARSRSRCAPARRSSSPHADAAETRRRVEAERACVALGRRRLPRAGRGAPRRRRG